MTVVGPQNTGETGETTLNGLESEVLAGEVSQASDTQDGPQAPARVPVLDGISAEMQASGVDMGAVEEPLPEEPITGEPVLEGAVQASPTAGVDRETMEAMVQANRDDGNRAG